VRVKKGFHWMSFYYLDRYCSTDAAGDDDVTFNTYLLSHVYFTVDIFAQISTQDGVVVHADDRLTARVSPNSY
jgi:hypothetical protein